MRAPGIARSLLVGTMAATAVAGPRDAHANAAAAEFKTPEAAAGALLARATSIAVEREELVIRCDGPRGAPPDCRFTATYQLANPTPEAHDALGAFYGGREVTVTLDGRDAGATLTIEQVAELDDAIVSPLPRALALPPGAAGAPSIQLPEVRRLRLKSAGFEVKLPAGARGVLVFAGRLDPVYRQNPDVYGGFAIPPHVTRHPLLGTSEDRDARAHFRYFLAPLRTWAGARAISIEIDVPGRWPLDPVPLAGGDGPWQLARAGGRNVARASIAGERAEDLEFEVTVPRHRVLNGGPFIAAGGTFGDSGGLRLRAGYEVARPSYILYSLALETNARDRLAGAAVVEAALPSFLFVFPSFALGAGGIVEHHPGATSPGVRLQAAAAFLVASAVFTADVYPGHAAGDPTVRLSLFGQLSF